MQTTSLSRKPASKAHPRRGPPQNQQWLLFEQTEDSTVDLRRGFIRNAAELKCFVTENYPRVMRYAIAAANGSRDIAEDVVQELYPRMLRMVQQNPEGLREPWAAVRILTRNLAADTFRKLARDRQIKRHHNVDEIVDIRETGEAAWATARIDEVRNAMTTLDRRIGRVLCGVYLEGRKGKDMAAELGLSESRLAELKALGIASLRSCLKG